MRPVSPSNCFCLNSLTSECEPDICLSTQSAISLGLFLCSGRGNHLYRPSSASVCERPTLTYKTKCMFWDQQWLTRRYLEFTATNGPMTEQMALILKLRNERMMVENEAAKNWKVWACVREWMLPRKSASSLPFGGNSCRGCLESRGLNSHPDTLKMVSRIKGLCLKPWRLPSVKMFEKSSCEERKPTRATRRYWGVQFKTF